jgi:hypothetical protein
MQFYDPCISSACCQQLPAFFAALFYLPLFVCASIHVVLSFIPVRFPASGSAASGRAYDHIENISSLPNVALPARAGILFSPEA